MTNRRRRKRSRATAGEDADTSTPHSSPPHPRQKRRISSRESDGAASGSVDAEPPTTGSHMECRCSVCLGPTRDPVVTNCGHLFCWACLYRSLQLRSHYGKCPVCKNRVSPDSDSVTPIYGSYAKGEADPAVPPRPRARRETDLVEEIRIRTEELRRLETKLVIAYGCFIECREFYCLNATGGEDEIG